MVEEGNLIKPIADYIIEYNLDTTIDLSEIGIDSVLNDSLFRDIPIIKTIYGIVKTTIAIREKYLLKKTLIFIDQLNKNNINNKNYSEYKCKLRNYDKFAHKELEHIIVILDKILITSKSKILANLYSNYINNNISWSDFEELSVIVDGFFLKDSEELRLIYEKNKITKNEVKSKASVYRLKSQSLVFDIDNLSRETINGDEIILDNINDYDFEISDLGRKLYVYGIISK